MTTDNDDILQRLRDPEQGLTSSDRFHLHKDAADEIRRLRAYIEEWKRRYEAARQAHEEGRAEIERLRLGLKMITTQEYDRGYTAETFADAILNGNEPLSSGQ